MNWSDSHAESERKALQAEHAYRKREFKAALTLYAEAARLEATALKALDASKPRTLGATAVSAVALWYKAEEYGQAEQLAYSLLATADIPEFARTELRNLVQAIWTESAKREAGVKFTPGEVLVSVRGGEVVTGGAPLDLILDKVQTIQAIFYRTVEFMNGVAHRRRGRPVREIQEACRPWLFQSVPGSYQFAVAIQRPEQSDLFKASFAPEEIATRFLEIVGSAGNAEDELLKSIVPSEEYRETFLKLTRNLAPTGKSFESVELRSPTTGKPVTLDVGARTNVGTHIRAARSAKAPPQTVEEVLKGVLRAVHLDKDWLELSVDGQAKRIGGLEDTVDDVIGPLINRNVTVRVRQELNGSLRFIDIEATE